MGVNTLSRGEGQYSTPQSMKFAWIFGLVRASAVNVWQSCMPMSEHKPRRGDKFYDESRKPAQCNGFILMIDWREHEVTVQFHDEDKSWKQYSFEEIEDHYDHVFMGGGYYLYERVSRLC